MADDPAKRGKPDRIRINVKQYHERIYWTRALGITKEALLDAVKAAGPMVAEVKKYLIARIKIAK